MIVRVVVFYVLTFLLTMVLGGVQEATGLATGWLTLPQLAPGLTALLMLVLFRRDGLRLSLSLRGAPPGRLLLALLAPLAVAAVVYALLRPGPGVAASSWWLLLPAIAVGALGEEVGWRGYLHKRLDPALVPLVSSALVGVLWAAWHVGLWANGPVYMACLVVLMIAYSMVLYALLAGTGFNVWVAAVFHLGINLANLPFLGIISDAGLRFIAVNAAVWAVVAAIVVLRRRDLFRRPGEAPGRETVAVVDVGQ
jgi:membrane protease YdiL (CAAX protease family)